MARCMMHRGTHGRSALMHTGPPSGAGPSVLSLGSITTGQHNVPAYLDIYVISEARDRETIDGFLHEFLPAREVAADEFEFPQFAEVPEVVHSGANEALEQCLAEPNIEYRMDWRARDGGRPEHATVLFLEDGHLIYGLSTDEADPQFAAELLTKLKAFVGSDLGYIGHEASPDASGLAEFKEQIARHRGE